MADQDTLFPLEFWINATPRSSQTSAKSKKNWQAIVRQASQERIRDTDELGWIDERPLAAAIFYFLPEPMQGDIDNIVKPILDALITVAYMNDRQIERVLVQRFEPRMNATFAAPSEQLAAALDAKPPVVYIRIDEDLAWRNLP